MALSAKQQIFVNEYAKTRSITKAAIKAGFSKKTASKQGSRLLTNVEVKAAVEARFKKIAERAELSAADVLAEIRKHAFLDLTRAFNDDGSIKDFSEMEEDVRKSLIGFETVELFAGRGSSRTKIGHARKIKGTDKLRALEMLAKHFKLLTDVVEHQGKGGGPIAFVALPPNGSEAPDLPSPANPTPDNDDAADA